MNETASGLDEFSLLRALAWLLSPSCNCDYQNFQLLTQASNHPLLCKLTNFSPIPKESPLTECNQLRPISLANIKSSIILKSAIGPDQFAYKKVHNTTMALIKCQTFWLEQLDSDADFVTAFSFDFAKAFDSVFHRVPCKRIVSYDINPYIKNWIMSFLCDRQQKVVVDGVVTSFLNIIYRGIPQETVLGPLLSMTSNLQSPKPYWSHMLMSECACGNWPQSHWFIIK